MSGFCKITYVSEHFTNYIVNVFRYRSAEWLPGQGNPFDDSLAFLDAFIAVTKAAYRAILPNSVTLLRAEAVGYDDAYNVVTSSPLVRTINEAGVAGTLSTTGSFISANIGLRCGEQVQISGIGTSKRNRGYLSIGPVGEVDVDDYGHLSTAVSFAQGTLAQTLDHSLTVVVPAVTLIPIRIHEKWISFGGVKALVFRTYSDIKGYTLPRKASVRRSRMGEA